MNRAPTLLSLAVLVIISAIALQQGPLAQSSPPPKTMTNSIGMEFVLIPAGTFMMGATDGEYNKHKFDEELPRHEVTLTRAFYMGKHEVTQKQWMELMSENPSKFTGMQNPVENVSWHDAQSFIKRLNDMHGNVWEWTQSGKCKYPSGSITDPVCSDGSVRVLPGGGWGFDARHCRSARRCRISPGNRFGNLGLRLSRSLP